ncbi:MAG: tyrosine-protein phosphatase [Oscillospiraceae bacterium]|nr:tyrosine-protein phosphatase [Oscillospiraceae bacterium]
MNVKKKKQLILFLFMMVIFSVNIVSASNMANVSYDEELGNFRNVRAGKIGRNNLYRSQHPANGSNRSLYANVLAEENGIWTILNLSDTKSRLNKYLNENIVGSSYYYKKLYNKGRVYTAGIIEFQNNPLYRNRIAVSLKFFAKNKGPYLVHCQVGRERTGMVILVLESLMGASYSYMVDDYAQSFMNVNGYNRTKAKKTAILRVNEGLCFITGKKGVTNWSKVNFIPFAENFLKQGGMTGGEIAALKKNLSVSYPKRNITLESLCIDKSR